MLNEKDIQNLVGTIADKLKRKRGAIDPKEFSPNYQLAVDIQQQIAVHCKAKNFPDKLMRAKAPNETNQELQYRKDIFEPITKPYWDRGLNALNRIWAEQNYSLTFKDAELHDYFNRCFPVYGSIITYFKTIVTHYKINDPNALFVIDIGELPVVEDDGEIEIDQSEALSPLCKIYPSNRVLYYERDEYALFQGDDYSLVNKGGEDELTGYVFYLFTTNSLYRIYQYGKKSDYTFKYDEVYQHNLGYLPARRLGGKQLSESQSGDMIYESYFMPAIPNLNKALKLDSTLDISINKMAYPVRAYYEAPCTNPNCRSGKVPVYDPTQVDALQDVPTAAMLKDCPVCGGRGYTMGFSPARDYVHTPRGGFNNEAEIPFPGFTYISSDPTILQFNESKITSDIEKAFMFMNIDVSLNSNNNINTGEKLKTATQSKIDREELFSFLLVVSEELFSLLQFGLDTIIKLRYPTGAADTGFTLCRPMTFEIRSLDELTTEIQNAQTGNAPDAVVRELLREYVALRFSAAKNLDAILQAVFYCDPLLTKSNPDIVQLRQQGLVSALDAVLHIHIFYFLEQKIMEDVNYLQKKLPVIRKDMVGLAKEKMGELG